MADVTITGLRVAPMGGPRVPTTVRAFARSSFLLADGNTAITATSPYTNEPYYKSVALNLSGLTYAAADFTLPATTDSVDNPNGARWGLFVFDQNNRLMYEVEGLGGLDSFWLDHTDASQSPEDIRSHNLGSLPALNDHDVNITGDLTVDGSVTATQFNGNGAGLTGVLGAGSGGTASSGSLSLIADIDNTDAGELIDSIFGSGGSSQTVFRMSRKVLTAYRPLALPAYTFAGLPAVADAPNSFARVTDNSRGLFYNDGTSPWFAVDGGIFNVRWFGAKGDGSTDDTAAIQAAITAALVAGGTVFFPTGTYKVTALTVAGSNVQLVGAGWSSVIAMSSATGDTITFVGADGGGVRNLKLVPSVTRTAGAEVRADLFSNMFLTDLYFFACNTCISLGASGADSGIAFVVNIRAYQFNRLMNLCRVLDGWYVNLSTAAQTAATTTILLDGGCEGNSFVNLDLVNGVGTPTGYALRIKNLSGVSVPARFNKFTNCLFDSHGSGASVEDGFDIRFTNCWFSNRGNGAVVTGTADMITFTDCDFINNSTNGLYIGGSGVTSVTGGSVIGNNSAGVAASNIASAGIAIDMVSGGIAVISNVVCKNDAVRFAGNVQSYGIWIANNAGIAYSIIGGDVFGNGTGGINALAAPSSLNSRIISGVIGFRTENAGSGTVASGSTSVAVAHDLAYTPTVNQIQITPTNNPTNNVRHWISAVSSTTFTVSTSADPGASGLNFGWSASIR